jgi:CheY-like chemotaxis protein
MLLRLSDAIDLRMAGAVHDLNNLLAVVLHAVEAIVPVAGQEEDLQAIAAAARRGQAMVRGLLSPEAVDAEPFAQAPVEMPPATHALDGLVNDLRGTLLHACGASVGLRIEPAAPDAAVTIDPTVLERVLLNLVVNARDAMTGGGVVVVRSHAPSPEIAVIEVRDDGPGIAPEVIARMGEPFFTTKPAGAGTGLGLATVRRLLAEAGGSLSIASTPGEGTCVSVRLAATPGREPTAASHAGTGGAGAGRAVLLVEDDAAQRRLVARALTSQGWMVLPAASAEEALALAGEAARDLAALVTDLALPGMDGEALARAARQKAGRMALPVVLVSGFAAAATQPESYTARLVKPYAMRDLGQVLAALAPDGEG